MVLFQCLTCRRLVLVHDALDIAAASNRVADHPTEQSMHASSLHILANGCYLIPVVHAKGLYLIPVVHARGLCLIPVVLARGWYLIPVAHARGLYFFNVILDIASAANTTTDAHIACAYARARASVADHRVSTREC